MRFEGFDASPLGGIADGLLRSAKVFGVEIPRAVQHFRVPQNDRGASRSADTEAHPSHHVLAHINYSFTSWRFENLHWLYIFDPANWRTRWSDQFRMPRIVKRDAFPSIVIVASLTPTSFFQARIVGPAIVDIRSENGPGRRFPGFIGDDTLVAAI